MTKSRVATRDTASIFILIHMSYEWGKEEMLEWEQLDKTWKKMIRKQ